MTNNGYAYNKAWREKNRASYNRSKKRNYAQTQGAANHRQPWTDQDCETILAHEVTDRELAAKLGRSVQAIQVQRARLKKEGIS